MADPCLIPAESLIAIDAVEGEDPLARQDADPVVLTGVMQQLMEDLRKLLAVLNRVLPV